MFWNCFVWAVTFVLLLIFTLFFSRSELHCNALDEGIVILPNLRCKLKAFLNGVVGYGSKWCLFVRVIWILDGQDNFVISWLFLWKGSFRFSGGWPDNWFLISAFRWRQLLRRIASSDVTLFREVYNGWIFQSVRVMM